MVKTYATSQSELASTAKPVGSRTVKSDSRLGATPVQAKFTSAAIGMSWQLAAIVLLALIGGIKLDEANKSSPLWTLIGLGLAVIGSILIIRRALMSVNNFSIPSADEQFTADTEVKHD